MPELPLSIVQEGDQVAGEEITIVRAVQTCAYCPSQWDAWDDQGRYYYLRHRNQRGSVDRYGSSDPDTWTAGPLGEIARFHGTELAGDGDLEELADFARQAGIRLADDLDLTTWQQYVNGMRDAL